MKKTVLIVFLVLSFVLLTATAATAAETFAEATAGAGDYPQLLSAAPTASGLTVSWGAFPDAAGYRLFYKGANGWIKVGDTSATSYTHSGLNNNTAYCYTVRALDGGGYYCSAYDREGLTAVFCSVPALSGVSNERTGQRVSWTAVPGAENYKVYIKTASAWRSVGTTAECSFLYEAVQPGTSYTYTVRCYTADGAQPLSYFDRSGISVRYVAQPELTACSPISGGNRLTWTRSEGADRYRLFIKRSGGGWTRIAETTATSFTHTGLANGATYTYTVRAFNAYGTAVSSFNPEGLTATYHSIPQLTGAVSVYGGQRVSWKAVPGAERYRVYAKSGDSWKAIGTTDSTSFLYRNAAAGANNTYTVRCLSADGAHLQSYFDKKGVSAVYYPAPAVTGFTPEEDGLEIRWSAVEGAFRYRLYYMTENGWKGVVTTSSTHYTHVGLTDGAVYTYTVRAMDSMGEFISGYCPDGWQSTYFAPRGVAEVSFDGGGCTVRWDKVEGVVGFQLYRRTPGSDWKLLLNTRKLNRTSYTDAEAPADEPCTYALRYVDSRERALSAFPTDTLYYLGGEPIDGALEWGGNTLYFESGRLRQGFVTVDGRLYYYDRSGVMIRSGIAGSDKEGYTVADENGVCCVSEEMRLAARFMMEHATGDTLDERMKTGYLYLAHQFPYHRTYDHPSKAEDMPGLAIDMFTNEHGNCYRYAACFACLAKAAGYRARVVLGSTGGNPHGWVEVLVDGKWLICDPDADIPKYGNPDYTAYMMKNHYWQITPKTRCEIVIDENGVASWQ